MNQSSKNTIIFTIVLSVLLGGISGAVFGFLGNSFAGQGLSVLLGRIGGPTNTPTPLPPATAEEASVISVIDRTAPAVVSIVLRAKVSSRTSAFPFDEFFDFPFAPAPRGDNTPGEERQIGGGSGFIVSDDGYILTNRHVVDDPDAKISVVTNSGKEYPAKVVALDPILDLAVIQIQEKNLPTLTLGDSDRARIGETVLAIGNALGSYRNTVTKGIISGLNRRIVAGDARGASEVIEDAIQTDAAINPGNSGGPLVDLRGQVIGIATAVERPAQSVGFAIPINIAKRAIADAQAHGRISRARLGVRYIMINQEIKDKEKLTVDRGALVIGGDDAVVPGSPAAKAGLKSGDVIVLVDGVRVDETATLAKHIVAHRAGDTVTLTVVRAGKELFIKVTLDEFPNK